MYCEDCVVNPDLIRVSDISPVVEDEPVLFESKPCPRCGESMYLYSSSFECNCGYFEDLTL